MSKKQIVIETIDRLIQGGEDFCDLTQGYLSELKELQGVSKTTIKRAKNEYKQQNTSIKNNFKEWQIKKRIYKYLDKNPKASLGDLREEFPNVIPPKVSEYHLFWKRKQEKKRQKDHKNIGVITPRKLKEMVFKYLDANPYTTSEQLATVFTNANRSSVSSYFNNWKKKQLVDKESVKKGSLIQVLFDYLDKNPASDIDDLKKAFVDVHKRSLEIYFSLWKKKHEESEVKIVETIKQEVLQLVEQNNGSEDQQEGKVSIENLGSTGNINLSESLIGKTRLRHSRTSESDKSGTETLNEKSLATTGKEGHTLPVKAVAESKTTQNRKIINRSSTETDAFDYDLIASLENTIEAQKTIIDVLNFEQHVLRQQNRTILSDSLDIDEEEMVEVRDFLALYLEGFKRQKTERI